MRYLVRTVIALSMSVLPACAQSSGSPSMADFFNALRNDPIAPYKDATWSVKTAAWLEQPEQNAGLVCKGVTDPNQAVRRYAVRFMSMLPTLDPKYNSIVTACKPSLIEAVHDTNGAIFYCALLALTLTQDVPSGLHDVYVQALHYKSTRPVHTLTDYQYLPLDEISKRFTEDQDEELRVQAADTAAMGLIKENQPGDEQLVIDAVEANHKLLSSLRASAQPSDRLFNYASRFLSDPDPEVQSEAIRVLVHNSTDPTRLKETLALVTGSKATAPVKAEANEEIAHAGEKRPW